jgi:hypothetical protein
MSDDDFIASLKPDWDLQTQATVLQLRRRRWLPHLLLSLDILGAVVMAVTGAGFAWAAVTFGDLLFVLASAAMLLAGLPLVIAAVRARLKSLVWDDETPEGVLRSTIARLDANTRSLRLGRGGGYTLLGLAILAWLGQAAGLIREPWTILLTITAAWALSGLLVLAWVRWRLGRTSREREGCEALLRQFEEVR